MTKPADEPLTVEGLLGVCRQLMLFVSMTMIEVRALKILLEQSADHHGSFSSEEYAKAHQAASREWDSNMEQVMTKLHSASDAEQIRQFLEKFQGRVQ